MLWNENWGDKMSKRFRLCVWLVALLAWSGFAGEDFSKGLAQFEKLGLPDVSNAEYVNLSTGLSCPWVYEMFSSHHFKLTGNAWLLKTTRDKNGRPVKGELLVNGFERIEVDLTGRGAVSWAKADLSRDVELSLAFLEETGGAKGDMGLDTQVRLYIFAMQLQQRRLGAYASHIFSELFQRHAQRSVADEAVMNQLAESHYAVLYRRLRVSYGWMEYRDGVKSLLAKLPQNLTMETLLRRMLPQIDRKAAAPDAVSNTSLSAAERELALGLSHERDMGALGTFETKDCPWLLVDAWKGKFTLADTKLKVMALGMDSLPFLLKLVEDDTLTAVDRKALDRCCWPGIPRRNAFDASPPSRLKLLVARVDRPATLGEVALCLLTHLLPRRCMPSGRLQAEDIFNGARRFYARHRGDSQEQLAVVLLESDPDNQLLLDFLFKLAKEKPAPLFEEYLLGALAACGDKTGEGEDAVDAAIGYASVRGRDAKEFVAKCVAKLEESGAKASADKIRAARYGSTAEEMLSEYLAKDEPDFDVPSLRFKLAAMGPDDVLVVLLRQAAAAETSELRAKAAKFLDELCDKELAGKQAVPAGHGDLWRVLFADDRPLRGGCYKVSDYFLACNERLYGAPLPLAEEDCLPPFKRMLAGLPPYFVFEEGDPAMKFIAKYQDAGRAFLRRRVMARLSGTAERDLPPWPDGGGDAGKLRQRLAALVSRDAAARMADGLSAEELELLPLALASDPALNVKLSGYANTVEMVDCGDDSFRRELEAWRGKVVTLELVARLREFCKVKTAAAWEADCLIERKARFGGCRLSVKTRPDAKLVGYAGMVLAEGLYCAARWRFVPEPEDGGWETFLTSPSSVYEGFGAAVAAFCAGKPPASSPGAIRFMSKRETEKCK